MYSYITPDLLCNKYAAGYYSSTQRCFLWIHLATLYPGILQIYANIAIPLRRSTKLGFQIDQFLKLGHLSLKGFTLGNSAWLSRQSSVAVISLQC